MKTVKLQIEVDVPEFIYGQASKEELAKIIFRTGEPPSWRIIEQPTHTAEGLELVEWFGFKNVQEVVQKYLEACGGIITLSKELSAIKQSTPISKVYCVSNRTAAMYFSQKENAESVVSNFGVTAGLGVTEIALLDAPLAHSEPVAEIQRSDNETNFAVNWLRAGLPHGTKLYTHPAALAEPVDSVGTCLCDHNSRLANDSCPLFSKHNLQASPPIGWRTWGGDRCDHCCHGDRCDDRSHHSRSKCPYCKGTGDAIWKAQSPQPIPATLQGDES